MTQIARNSKSAFEDQYSELTNLLAELKSLKNRFVTANEYDSIESFIEEILEVQSDMEEFEYIDYDDVDEADQIQAHRNTQQYDRLVQELKNEITAFLCSIESRKWELEASEEEKRAHQKKMNTKAENEVDERLRI